MKSLKQAHLQWVNRLEDLLEGKAKLNQNTLDTHTTCILGQWYYKQKGLKLSNMPEFQAIEAPHIQMHQVVHKVVGAYQQGDLITARQGVKQVVALSRQIVGALEALEQAVIDR